MTETTPQFESEPEFDAFAAERAENARLDAFDDAQDLRAYRAEHGPHAEDPHPLDDSWLSGFTQTEPAAPAPDGFTLEELERLFGPDTTPAPIPTPAPAWRPAEPEDSLTDWIASNDVDEPRYVPLVELTEAEQGALGYMQMLIEAVEQGERLSDAQAGLLTLARLLAQSEK